MTVGYKDMNIHAMVEGNLSEEVQKCVTYVNQNHENVWLKSPVDHPQLITYYGCHSS